MQRSSLSHEPVGLPTCPLLWLSATLAIGIVMGTSIGAKPVSASVGSGLCAASALLTLLAPRRRLVTLRPLVATILLLLSVGLLGVARWSVWQEETRLDFDQLPAKPDLCVQGKVVSEPETASYGVHYVVLAERRRLTGRVEPGSVQVRVRQRSDVPSPVWGATVSACGSMEPLPLPRNPFEFDYGAYLSRRGIAAELRARRVVVSSREDIPFFLRHVSLARTWVARTLDRYLPDAEGRSILYALVLGRRTGIDRSTRELFALMGLSHLLAISGLHVLLVGMVLHGLLRPLLVRIRLSWGVVEIVRALVTWLFLAGYAVLCGAGASVVRAVVMASVFLAGQALQRTASSLNGLGAAALLLLLSRPSVCFDVGFQLSFSAVAGIILLRPGITSTLSERLPRWTPVWDSVAVSYSATLATAPVLLFHFGRIAPAGMLLNLVAIPLTAGSLTAGLLTLLTAFAGPFADVFGAAAALLARSLLFLARNGALVLSWTSAELWIRDPWILCAVILGLLAYAARRRATSPWPFLITAIGCCTASVAQGTVMSRFLPTLEITVLDVGHGDAVLVRYPNGAQLLADAGARTRFVDHGARTVGPYLAADGSGRVDLLLLSHPHGDHIGGAASLMRRIPVGRLAVARVSIRESPYRSLAQIADSLAIPLVTLTAGDSLDLDPQVLTEVLWPPASVADPSGNEASVVLRLRFGRTTFLLMGDAERIAEETLCDRFGPRLKSEAVKVGHHGSRTSSAPCFVGHSRPTWAVVSVGRPGTYGLPDEDVVERWESVDAQVPNTYGEGAVILKSDGVRTRRVTWR